MKPIEFKGMNAVYGASQPEYQPLPAHVNKYGDVMTCWELNDDEIKAITENRCIWVGQLTFNKPLQPIILSATRYTNERGEIEINEQGVHIEIPQREDCKE